jgi:hypothetical protein
MEYFIMAESLSYLEDVAILTFLDTKKPAALLQVSSFPYRVWD